LPQLKQQGLHVRVGMEASGHGRWFERLLGDLQFELWVGNAAEIRTMRAQVHWFKLTCAYRRT
jgi:hypothetical protein